MSKIFLLASLPTPLPGAPPPVSLGAFLELCRRQLGRAELAAVDAVLSGDAQAAGPSGRLVLAVEQRIHMAAGRARALRKRLDPPAAAAGWPSQEARIDKLVAEAFAAPDPLERELALDRVRWRLLDELCIGRPFEFTSVLVYAQKLRLLERLAALEEARGRAALEAALDSIPLPEPQR